LATTTAPVTSSDTRYWYDLNGNRTRVQRNGTNEWYGHDPLDRLLWTNTAGAQPPNLSGQFAPWNAYAYDDFGQQVVRLSGGSLPQAGMYRQQQDLRWDSAGRLREVKDRTLENQTTLSAQFTADGERIQKSDPYSGSKVSSFGPGALWAGCEDQGRHEHRNAAHAGDQLPEWAGGGQYDGGDGGAGPVLPQRSGALWAVAAPGT